MYLVDFSYVSSNSTFWMGPTCKIHRPDTIPSQPLRFTMHRSKKSSTHNMPIRIITSSWGLETQLGVAYEEKNKAKTGVVSPRSFLERVSKNGWHSHPGLTWSYSFWEKGDIKGRASTVEIRLEMDGFVMTLQKSQWEGGCFALHAGNLAGLNPQYPLQFSSTTE